MSNIAQSLYLEAPRRLVWREEPLPPVGPTDVRVRTIAGAISIGTELPLYTGEARLAYPISYPTMTGYESLAEVVEVGERVSDVVVGMRVIAFYGHRTAAVLPAERVIPVPADVSAAQALLLILACDCAKGVSKVKPTPADKVVITGAGAIGLLTLFNLLTQSVEQVAVVEPLAARRELARRLGATAVFHPNELQNETGQFDAGFECSSRDAAFGLLQRVVGANGRICILADGNLEPLTLTPAFHAKELTVVGSSDGLDYRAYAMQYWSYLRTFPFSLTQLFQAQVQRKQLAETFAALAVGAINPVKVLVLYDNNELR